MINLSELKTLQSKHPEFVLHPLSTPDDKNNSPGKRPLIAKWETLKKTPTDIKKYITKGYNLGLVCGSISGVMVIDLDHELFVNEIFQGIELNTLRSGRTKGRGHIYFKYKPDLPASKHHDLGIEVLSDGNNAVLPPSIHASGDVYKWVNPDAPIMEMPDIVYVRLLELFQTEAELKQLTSKCRHCFRQVLKNREGINWHGAEGREYMMAVCTDLKARGAVEKHIKMFAKLIYREKYDESRTLQEWQHIDAVKTWTCDKLKEKLPLYVDVIQCEKCTERKERHAATEKEQQLSYEPEPEQNQQTQDRKIVLSLPEDHFISQYVKWGESVTDAYCEYHIVNALWLLSAATNRKVVLKLRQEYVRPNLWILTLGNSTTSRKSTAVNKARKIFECASEITLPNADFSLEGYLESLAKEPVMHNVRDEASGLLAKFHQKYNDGIFDLECTVYDGSPETIEKRLASGKAKEPRTYTIKNYYVTKLYATTPDKLAHCMSIDDFMCGYGYRWIYNYPKYKHSRKPLEIEQPEDVTAWVNIVAKMRDFCNIFRRGTEVEFKASKETMQYYDSICIELEKEAEEQNSDILSSIVGRAQIHILKIAMLLEMGKKEVSMTITDTSIKIASDMVIEYFIPSIMDVMDRIQEDIKNNMIEKITSILRRLGGTATHTKLLRDSNLKSRDFNDCISTMLESHRVKTTQEKPRAYRLIDYTNLNLRNVRKVRNVREYVHSTNNSTNFTNSNSSSYIRATPPPFDLLRTYELYERYEQNELNEKIKQIIITRHPTDQKPTPAQWDYILRVIMQECNLRMDMAVERLKAAKSELGME